MKLTTVLGSVNNNPAYYMFIPKQILFWAKFNIRFIAVFVGESVPPELEAYKANILLWTRNKDMKSAFIGQNIRIYYPALLDLPDDELVMITDMDMLPMNHTYYTAGLDSFTTSDFIYYREVDGNQIYMCYNAAHPRTWANIFGIKSEDDIERALNSTYNKSYGGYAGCTGWYSDQLLMYERLIKYPHLKVLNRPIKRLEMGKYRAKLNCGDKNFISRYDDSHFHRSYFDNEALIADAERQLANF